MKNFMAPAADYDICKGPEGNFIKVADPKPRHVTGTTMAGILGCSPWSSPFTVACDLLNLGREDISGKPAVRTGIALEAPIIKYADEVYSEFGSFIPAELAFGAREGPHDTWASDFQDEVFAGHVDGIVDKDGRQYILEVKTSSNLESWENGVPEYYYWQVALYNEFMCKQDKVFVLLGIVNERTHADPMTWVPNERTVKLFELPIDREQVREKIAEVREWYRTYVLAGTTPYMNPLLACDQDVFGYLSLLATDVSELRKTADEYGRLSDNIDEVNLSLKDEIDRQAELKDRLKAYMTGNNTTLLPSETGAYEMAIQTQVRKSLDEARMIADGIDLDKYRITKETKVFKMKKNKGE